MCGYLRQKGSILIWSDGGRSRLAQKQGHRNLLQAGTATKHGEGVKIETRLYLSSPFIILIIAIHMFWRRYIPNGWIAKLEAHLATTTAQVFLCKGGQQPANNALYRRCTVKAFGHFSPDAIYKICGIIYAKATRGSLTYISAFYSGLDTTAITGSRCVFIYLFLHLFFLFFFLLFTLFFYHFFKLGLCSLAAEEHWVAQAGG